MSIKYTRTTLQKIEKLYAELEYKVRYEKGSFQSGYCLVESKQIAVINKFFDVKGRINVLLDILSNISYDFDLLTEEGKAILVACGLSPINIQEAA